MAKIYTPAMAAYDKKHKKSNKDQSRVRKETTPFKESMRRLFKNKLAVGGLIFIILMVVVAVLASVLAPYDPNAQDYSAVLAEPSREHWFGTDNYGRDIFSRVMFGARISVPIGFCCAVSSMACGAVLGVIAAYYGGAVEEVIMRVCDMFQAIPAMLLALAVLAALGNGLGNLIIANMIALTPAYTRVARGAIYTVKECDFIEASRALGAGNLRQMFVHMLPNALGPIIIQTASGSAGAILVVSGLSYLGLGIVPPTAEWGAMVSEARTFLTTASYYILFPGLMIVLTVLAINLFGDGLRDALDPKMK